jgi:two-component system, NtrC family, sensor kinase
LALRGLKTKIAFNVALLLLVSAIITDVLAILFAQNFLIRREIVHHKNFLETIGQLVSEGWETPDADRLVGQIDRDLPLMLQRSGFEAVFITSAAQQYFRAQNSLYPEQLLRQAAEEANRNHKAIQHGLNEEWSLFIRRPQALLIAFAMEPPRQRSGAVSAVISLAPVYQAIRDLNKPILLYIAINTIILTVIGLYRIFRIYLRPIDRIIRQADEYREDEDLFFAFRREDNELNRLSVALNRMLKRLSSDRQQLKDTVESLEKANLDLKQAQSDIIRAEKLASIGRLAAGIAHEIGNPIGIVIGYLDLLGKSTLSDAQRTDFLQRAEAEIQRINRIIRQLLDLARPKENQAEIIHVHQVIDETIEVMRVQPIMKGLQIINDSATWEPYIYGSADQLRQVLLNLLINSADAIRSISDKHDGCIRISTASETDAADLQKFWLRICCTDNGPGIPAQCIDYIFDPFYTSKDPGKGTGLGLAVSFMIVEQLGGTISVQNEPNGGATMVIRLPMIAHSTHELNEAPISRSEP